MWSCNNMPNACVYILLLENNSYYVGSTTDFSRRIKEHNKCNHAGTKYSKPQKVLLVQEFATYSLAHKIESRLKRSKSRKLIDKIIADGNINIKLLGM